MKVNLPHVIRQVRDQPHRVAAWKYVAEFTYRRNMRHSHSAMFDLLIRAFRLPRLAET